MKQKPMRNPTLGALQSKSRRLKMKSNTTRLRKVKQPSKLTLKRKVWSAFSKYIRLRDCLKTTGTLTHGKCITCGKLLSINFCDAGHFVSRRYNATLFAEKNCHIQCRYCNRYLHGNLLEYRRQIIKLYGEGADIELEDKAMEIKRYTPQALTELEKYYIIEVENLQRIAESKE